MATKVPVIEQGDFMDLWIAPERWGSVRLRDRMAAVVGPHERVVVTGGWSRDAAVMEVKSALGAVHAPPGVSIRIRCPARSVPVSLPGIRSPSISSRPGAPARPPAAP